MADADPLWRGKGVSAKPRGAAHLEPQAAIIRVMSKRPQRHEADVPLDEKTREAIREGLAQAERGEFVPDRVVEGSNKRNGI
jgi:hypothetical protein